MFGKKNEERMQDAYDDGFAVGFQLGMVAAETEIFNNIAAIGDLDWLLDELEDMKESPDLD
jgi:hypothetical protein